MNGSDYRLIQVIDRIYLKDLCCPMPPRWAQLSNRISSAPAYRDSGERYPPSLILGGWSSSDTEKRNRLFEQILFAYRHSAIDEACDYLGSLSDDEWHKMSGSRS